MIDFKAKPFFLNDGQIEWVKETAGKKIGRASCRERV